MISFITFNQGFKLSVLLCFFVQPTMLAAGPPAAAAADAAQVRGRRGRAHQPRGEREVPPARRRQHRLGAAALQVSQFSI